MIAHLAATSIRSGKARFACAVIGIAAATGAMVFSTSLVATNNAQAPYLARRAAAPWQGWKVQERAGANADLALSFVNLTVDYRPQGRVLQGPPMRAMLALAPGANPYGAVQLAEGRWVNAASEDREVVCVKGAMRRFGAKAPALGEELKFVGREGTMTARIVGYLDGAKLPREFPYVFANASAFNALSREKRSTILLYSSGAPADALTSESAEVIAAFKSDEQRRMDYATPLMLIAAILTAISLLVNSLLLSIESNRKALSILRMVGMGRRGAVAFTLVESLVMALCGWALGTLCALAGLWIFVHTGDSFPAGCAVATSRILATLAAILPVAAVAVLCALKSALGVRPADALSKTKRPRRSGMAVTFALGFAAFVAVEVWGASLMRAFVPSPEWPDAIVSLLPGGASSFDIEKLRDIEGVSRISELLPLQVFLEGKSDNPRRRPNALFLAAEWLPDFVFTEGERASAAAALRDKGEVVITRMMSRARNLHKGDEILGLKIAGVIDLNWHMVTSRGLLRGLNGMPPMTDGPIFASFDTVESLDRRPAPMVKMTHLWVEYDKEFLSRNGVFKAGRHIEDEIARRLGYDEAYTVRLHARDEIQDGTLAHGNDVIGAAARVPFFFLAVLAIGFIAMIVAEADVRRHELAAYRAVGATRADIAALLVRSAVKVALAGVAAGLPIGAAAGYLASLKTAAIWPGMVHYFVIPWAVTIEGALGALALAIAFATPAALALARKTSIS